MCWDGPNSRASEPQLFVPLVAIGKVAHHSGESPQVSGCVLERHCNGVGPETRSILASLPTLTSHVSCGNCPLELVLQFGSERFFPGVEKRYVPIDGRCRIVAVYTGCSGIPGGDSSARIQ